MTTIHKAVCGFCRVPLFTFTLILSGLCIASHPAAAFETIKTVPAPVATADEPAPFFSSTPVPQGDPCLPLLNTVNYAPSASAMDRHQRSAGGATAIGLVLGVRFALGPKEMTSGKKRPAKLDIWQPNTGGVKALAVADYRRCKNESALKALDDWRWSR